MWEDVGKLAHLPVTWPIALDLHVALISASAANLLKTPHCLESRWWGGGVEFGWCIDFIVVDLSTFVLRSTLYEVWRELLTLISFSLVVFRESDDFQKKYSAITAMMNWDKNFPNEPLLNFIWLGSGLDRDVRTKCPRPFIEFAECSAIMYVPWLSLSDSQSN